jgi:hypothetical protein
MPSQAAITAAQVALVRRSPDGPGDGGDGLLLWPPLQEIYRATIWMRTATAIRI